MVGMFLSIIFALSLVTEIELKGSLSGLLDYSGEVVRVKQGDSVKIVPYGTDADYDSTGWLIIKARSIYIEGVIDGMGRGYGGGGGGGGAAFIYQYGDAYPGAGGGDKAPFEGDPGGDAYYEEVTPGQQWAVYGGDGGAGGGIGGESGMDGGMEVGGTGGRGAGKYGGSGGSGGDLDAGGDGGPGGYMGIETNGDTTTDFRVVMGSGGGGGGGGGSTIMDGYPGGYSGGAGGVGGGSGCEHAVHPTLSAGGGGGGGGAGGAAITLDATDTLSISGAVIADGAGSAELGGGYGAGGGIALRGRIVDLKHGLLRTLGGFSDKKGKRINGGTIKVFYEELDGDVPEENAGRVYKRKISIGIEEEKRSLPLLLVSPNPFRKSTVISYHFSGKAGISLEVYDISGRIVKTLTRIQNPKPGVCTLRWDGRDEMGNSVPSGIYFFKLKGEGDTFIKKVILMR